jgi:hypothetical protein
MGFMSMRSYLMVGLALGAFAWLIATFFGRDVASSVAGMEGQALAANMGVIAQLICEPIIWVMRNPVFGGILVALTWPVVLLWGLLYFAMLLIALGSDAANDVNSQIH